MAYTIEIRGLEAVQQKLRIPLDVVLRPAFLAIGQEVKARIAVAPGPVQYPIEWKSEKQRRYYFAMYKDVLPYVRGSSPGSQRLEMSWAVEVQGLSAIVGTRVTYAPFVQNAEQQQPFHRNTGWKTDREVAEEVAGSDIIERACSTAIRAALG